MFGTCLGGGDKCKQGLVSARKLAALQRTDARKREVARGEGAGLVPDDRLHLSGALQQCCVADKDPRLGATTHADDHGGRRGEAHRAWAGDNEHGDCGGNSADELRFRAEEVPADKGEDADQDDRGDKDLGDAVGEPGDRRLRRLCTLYGGDNAGECRSFSDCGGADHQRGIRDEGTRNDAAPLSSLHWGRFAGEK